MACTAIKTDRRLERSVGAAEGGGGHHNILLRMKTALAALARTAGSKELPCARCEQLSPTDAFRGAVDRPDAVATGVVVN